MQISGEPMWALLRSLDDPDHLEYPAGHDDAATRATFERLVAGLDAAFGCRTKADRGVQDASLHASVIVPAAATASGERLVVCVSNFGGLATLTLENPGIYEQEELDVLLDDADARRAHGVLDALGYVVVPEASLWQPYHGPSRSLVVTGEITTWWGRFFDYL